MENLRPFMEGDFSSAAESNDYNSFVQSRVNRVLNRCAEETQWSVEEKNFDDENFGWFANCVQNNVFLDNVLNQNQTARANMTSARYWEFNKKYDWSDTASQYKDFNERLPQLYKQNLYFENE